MADSHRVLTFVTTCWQGPRPYLPWHIVNCRAMLRKHVSIPHRFVCLTDNVPDMEAAGIEARPLWNLPKIPESFPGRLWANNYVRLGLYDPELTAGLGDWLCGIDADIVVRDNIDYLFDTDAPVKLMRMNAPGRGWLQGGLQLIRPAKISVNPWRAIVDDPEVITRATLHRRCGGGTDQAVLTYLFGDTAATWNETDGLSINDYDQPGWKLFFRTGHGKPWMEGMPERETYYAESGADPATCPEYVPPVVTRRYSGARGALARGGLSGLRAYRLLQIAKRTKC